MNWLILFRHYHPKHVGGTTTYVRRFAKALADNGHQVHIVTTRYDDVHSDCETENNIQINYVDTGKGVIGPLRFFQRNKFSHYVDNFINNNNFDIINIHDGFTITSSLTKKISESKAALLYTLHAVVYYECLYNILYIIKNSFLSKNNLLSLILKSIVTYITEKTALKLANHVIVMSEYVKGTVGKYYGNTYNSKIFISSIGINNLLHYNIITKSVARTLLNIQADCIMFFTVRRLEPRMGLTNLIKAWKEVNCPNCILYIAGSGSLLNQLSYLINKHELQNKVCLLGHVSNEELNHLYCASDCFIMPSEQLEGFGIVTLDALMYGLPVIGTPRGATPEILKFFQSELITENHTQTAIKDKINHFLDNVDAYKHNSNQSIVLSKYNWDHILNDLINHINSNY